MFTIFNWICFGLIFLAGLSLTILLFTDDEVRGGIICLVITFALIGGMMLGINWWHTSTAEGTRAMRDYTSNINNGYEREITVTAEDGRIIYHYSGKIDIETDHEKDYILFDDENGKRHIIYYGIQDTVLIIDK